MEDALNAMATDGDGSPGAPGAAMERELFSQPDCWVRGAAESQHPALPRAGERVAVVGCGTSWFIAQAYARVRESAGLGLTDAFAASEYPTERDYDVLLAISRSGTTTEVLDVLRAAPSGVRTIGITGPVDSPMVELVDHALTLPYADEESVVQTRFATTALALLRASVGHDIPGVAEQARRALSAELPAELLAATQFTFLGRGWAVGIANEAALKLRETSQVWTESYPAFEYRHGPISIAAPSRVTWLFGDEPAGLGDEVRATGAHFETSSLDPLADLVRVHRVALERARAAGLDSDRPRNLTRSVVLAAGR